MLREELPGPKFVQLYWPVISALKQLGGSARAAEATNQVVTNLAISDAERSETLANGTSRFDNWVAWARFYLAKAEYIDSSRHGVWTLTEQGESLSGLSHDAAMKIFRDVQSNLARAKSLPANATEEQIETDEEAPAENHWQTVLSVLRSLPAEGFERFCQRLLRESGFEEVTVTGRSGDGGIDGIGVLSVNALVSFKVLFQCKRYKDGGSVVPSQVRDFRGAMQGRADKGIILTTGTFTADARREAMRDGVPPIELVDGTKLVAMIEELELGLKPVQTYRIDDAFFHAFGFKTDSTDLTI